MFLVFDSSVVISAFFAPNGISNRLLSFNGKRFLICTSEIIIQEIKEKLTAKNISSKLIEQFISVFIRGAEICDSGSYTQAQINQDDHIIGCLKSGPADMIVTYDHTLIRRCKKEKISAVTPIDLLHILNDNTTSQNPD